MNKKPIFLTICLLTLLFFSGCESEPVEVIVTREVEVETVVEVEVTREVEVEVEVPQVVIVTPAGNVESAEASDPYPASVPEPTADTPREQSGPTTLRMAHELIWGGNETLDPYAPTRFDAYARLAYERLVRVDGNGELVPVLA
ncbi:MAG: hypothetical protein AAF902_10175, partial [Chloroflexota bacterium]